MVVPGLVEPGIKKRLPEKRAVVWTNALMVAVLLYLFLVGIKLMGGSFKLMGEDFTSILMSLTDNPLAGLFVGVLATAIVQSSSVTTSLTVTLVASGSLDLAQAIPIVMGANIGTSVTNTLVSLVHIKRRDEFRRAFAGAIVHDLFNWCTVLVFLPLELITRALAGQGYLQYLSQWLSDFFVRFGGAGIKSPNLLKVIYVKQLAGLVKDWFKAGVKFVADILCEVPEPGTGAAEQFAGTLNIVCGIVLGAASLVLLFFVLVGMTKVLKQFVVGRLEKIIDNYIFKYAIFAYLIGVVATAVVQSSSVTTSMIVPLLGAGLLTIEQVYPYTVGANVGTTITALLAALTVLLDPEAANAGAGLTIAIVHLLFNVHGSAIFLPLKKIPITAAKWYANLAAEKTRFAVVFVLGVFFVMPGLVIWISYVLSGPAPK